MKVKILSDFKHGEGKDSTHYRPGDEAELPEKVALAYPDICQPMAAMASKDSKESKHSKGK